MRILLVFFCSSTIFSCSSVKKNVIQNIERLESNFNHHSGFMLYDISQQKVLAKYNSNKYFTPASNTKILTFYTALRLLGDSIPALEYYTKGDSLIFWGTGDPSFLYSELPQGNVLQQLVERTEKGLYFSSSNFHEKLLGPGWAWDDANYSFSTERTPFPIYGNLFSLSKFSDSPYLHSPIDYFKSNLWLEDTVNTEAIVTRGLDANDFYYYPSKSAAAVDETIPFHYSDHVLKYLLSDTLKRKVYLINTPKPPSTSTLYSIPADTAYKVMMQESDNFIAEQLLMVCANQLTDSLYIKSAVDYSLANFLDDLPDKPVWLDGSGLSRYNLITPRALVHLWKKIYEELPEERLFSLLATGGESGTLKNYYKMENAYVYGKTGTLSNVHNLSGFLKTKKGNTLIFSLMNNNYPNESRPVKKEMERILETIYENY